MNILTKIAFFTFCIVVVSYSEAQSGRALRPDLFGGFSQKIVTPVTELSKVFTVKEGTSLSLKLDNEFSFSGTVYSSVTRYKNLSSVVIKSPALHNALLCISRRVNDDNTITYVGRIINEQYGDGYELRKDNAGVYSFNKIRTADLIQDY